MGVPEMCDYSLESVRSRPAKVGDKLTTRDFGTLTRGFAAAENARVAVCVLPGTELAVFQRGENCGFPLRRPLASGKTKSRDSNLPTSE